MTQADHFYLATRLQNICTGFLWICAILGGLNHDVVPYSAVVLACVVSTIASGAQWDGRWTIGGPP